MKHRVIGALLSALLGAAGSGWAQQQSEKQVSGPDQMNSRKSTGKSYKKGTKKPSAKEENPSTGQNRRLGNTGDLTKNGDDVNGKRGERSNKRKTRSDESQEPKQ
jgi:hypothetical protein